MGETGASPVGTEAFPTEWLADELARIVRLPVRTIREYQTLGLLPAPRRQGRVGLYGSGHLRRLELIARLRDRGYSLAGIHDLLGSWSAGSDLSEVLGLEPDQLVHVDEPGAPATLDQLRALFPTDSADHIAALEATGVIEPEQPGRYCIPSPSLLQLAVEAQAAGLTSDAVIRLLESIRRAADIVAEQVVQEVRHLPREVDPATAAAFLRRGRGLLGHGIGRLTLHRIGRELGIGDADHARPGSRRVDD